MAVGDATIYEVIDDGWNIAFTFWFGAVFGEELGEVIHEFSEERNRKSPKVHGDDDIFINEAGVASDSASFDLVVVFPGDFDDFLDAFEKAVVDLANPAIDRTMIGEGVNDMVTDKSIASFHTTRIFTSQEIGGLLIRVGSVKIVCIDDGEWAIYFVACGENGVRRSPRFLTSFWGSVSFG